MFPDLELDEIKKTYEKASSSLDRAAELLLESISVLETQEIKEEDLSLDKGVKQKLLTNFDEQEDGIFILSFLLFCLCSAVLHLIAF
jgi:hypothetical protein